MRRAHHSPVPVAPRASWVVACALVLVAGCDRTIDTDYAAVRGPSINGISAFVQMLRDTGHATTATRRLPAVDDRCRALVVFTDRFGPIPGDARERLGRFLEGSGSQMLVLVVRDDDCAVGYWRALAAREDLAEPQRQRVSEQLAEARATLAADLAAAEPPDTDAFGYTLEAVDRPADAGPLRVEVGSPGGFADAAVEARWQLHRRLVPGAEARVLWRSGADPLLVRIRRGGDEILVVAAATPLVNGGLVDPGNRRLAADLVARIPVGGRVHVVGSSVVSLDEDSGAEPSIWRLLAVMPHPWIAAQALAAMAIFCWWRTPILGRPRRESPAAAQDFGHHVAALGSLLARARGDGFAERRLAEWRRIAAPVAAGSRPRKRGHQPEGGRHADGR